MQPFSVETLALSQIRALYRERLTRDFPPDEVKSLSIIERAMGRGEYVCYGAVSGGDILAYAFFVTLKEDGKPCALFDYYAVRDDLRGQGVGSRFIQALIKGPLRDMDAVLLEVDDPACGTTPEEKNIRDRRLAFYLRNGLQDADVTATVFGVRFKILTLPVGRALSKEEVRRKYAAMYRAILPLLLYKTMVRI